MIAARPEQIALIAGEAAADRLASMRGVRDYLAGSDLRDRPLLDCTSAVANHFRETMAGLIVEEVRALYLDARSFLIRIEILSRGSVGEAALFPREIVRRSLELGAKSLIIAHNHPSGDLQPSSEDKAITEKLSRAAALFDISLLDHFIVSGTGWLSFRAQGLL